MRCLPPTFAFARALRSSSARSRNALFVLIIFSRFFSLQYATGGLEPETMRSTPPLALAPAPALGLAPAPGYAPQAPYVAPQPAYTPEPYSPPAPVGPVLLESKPYHPKSVEALPITVAETYTNFDCRSKPYPGRHYADVEAGCEIYHF